jgi:rod shape-determining protein MreD
MYVVLYIIIVLVAFLAQTSPLLTTIGSGWRIDLALLVVVYFSLFWNGQRALIFGFTTGLLQDALSSETLGVNGLSKTLVVFVLQLLCRNVQVHSPIAQGLFACLAIAIDTCARITIMLMFQLNAFEPRIILITMAQQMVLSLLIIPFICRTIQALEYGLRIRQRGDTTA